MRGSFLPEEDASYRFLNIDFMERGETIFIKETKELADIKLEKLANRKGVIEDTVTNWENKITGYWIKLDGNPFEGEQEWFVPANSIELQ
jgi:hypothetical protein